MPELSPRLAPGLIPDRSDAGPKGPLFEREPADFELGGVELRRELLDESRRIGLEDVLDDPDLRVVVKRQIDVLLRDKIDRGPAAGRATHGQADLRLSGREQ